MAHSQFTIAYLDDNPIQRAFLEMFLNYHKYNNFELKSAEEAINVLGQLPVLRPKSSKLVDQVSHPKIDAMVSDIQLIGEEMDGFAPYWFVRGIEGAIPKNGTPYKKIPFVYVSSEVGDINSAFKDRIDQIKASDPLVRFLPKPYNDKMINEALEDVLGLSRKLKH